MGNGVTIAADEVKTSRFKGYSFPIPNSPFHITGIQRYLFGRVVL